MFGIHISNINLGNSQLDIWYSKIECPSGKWFNKCLILEY